jgi:BON domain
MKATLYLASIALAGVFACADSDRTAERTGSPATSPPATQEPTTPGTPTTMTGLPAMSEADRALAQLVKDALQKNTGAAPAGENIQVHARNGEVTLRGSVNSEQEKADIAATAKQVAGVTAVNNQLEVASASRL